MFVARRAEFTEEECVALHRKLYINKFFWLLLLNLICVVIGGVTCLLDGLSDTENGLLVPVLVGAGVCGALEVFFIAYTLILRKKYNIRYVAKENNLRTKRDASRVEVGTWFISSFLFALHTIFVVYTIILMIG